MVLIIVICIIVYIISVITAYILGKQKIRNNIYESLQKNFFGCMIANVNVKDKDDFIETHFYYSPREILGREFVMFEVKIRE